MVGTAVCLSGSCTYNMEDLKKTQHSFPEQGKLHPYLCARMSGGGCVDVMFWLRDGARKRLFGFPSSR